MLATLILMTVDLLVFRGSHNNKRNLIMQLSKQLSASIFAANIQAPLR